MERKGNKNLNKLILNEWLNESIYDLEFRIHTMKEMFVKEGKKINKDETEIDIQVQHSPLQICILVIMNSLCLSVCLCLS